MASHSSLELDYETGDSNSFSERARTTGESRRRRDDLIDTFRAIMEQQSGAIVATLASRQPVTSVGSLRRATVVAALVGRQLVESVMVSPEAMASWAR